MSEDFGSKGDWVLVATATAEAGATRKASLDERTLLLFVLTATATGTGEAARCLLLSSWKPTEEETALEASPMATVAEPLATVAGEVPALTLMLFGRAVERREAGTTG